MTRRRLTLVAGLALAITASLATPSFAQKGLAAESARINALRSAGKYSEALPLAQAMVASLEKTTNNRDLAGALNNLAQIYADQGHDDQAEPLYKRAIALMEKGTGLDSVEIAPVLNNLAALYQRQSRFAEAEPLFKRALAVREKALSREHPDVGQSLNNLATLLCQAAASGRSRAVVSARARDLPEGRWPRASGGRDAPEQSRPARSRPQPRCGCRGADQALARDPRKGAGTGPSRRRALAEQSRRSLRAPAALCRCGAALSPCAVDPRTCARSRSSGRYDLDQQSRLFPLRLRAERRCAAARGKDACDQSRAAARRAAGSVRRAAAISAA